MNAASGVGVLLVCDGRVLVVERAQAPGEGGLDVPGGFVDPGEGLLDALVREVREELGVVLPRDLRFHASFGNEYRWGGLTYSVCDSFFVADLPSEPPLSASEEVRGITWLGPAEVPLDRFAFLSTRRAVQAWMQERLGQAA